MQSNILTEMFVSFNILLLLIFLVDKCIKINIQFDRWQFLDLNRLQIKSSIYLDFNFYIELNFLSYTYYHICTDFMFCSLYDLLYCGWSNKTWKSLACRISDSSLLHRRKKRTVCMKNCKGTWQKIRGLMGNNKKKKSSRCFLDDMSYINTFCSLLIAQIKSWPPPPHQSLLTNISFLDKGFQKCKRTSYGKPL